MTRIELRRGTANEWAVADPILATGEPGFETDTGKFKVGNGTAPWSQLPAFLNDVGPNAAFARVFTPEAYGAKADGVTDDSAAINAAMTAARAAGGGTILFAGGKTYAVAAMVSLPATVPLRVRMESGAWIKATAVMDAVVQKPLGACSGIVLDNLHLDANQLAARCLDVLQGNQLRIVGGAFQSVPASGGGAVVEFSRTGGQVYEVDWAGGRITGRLGSAGGTSADLPVYGIRAWPSMTDSHLHDIEVSNAKTGVYDQGAANHWRTVHVYAYPYKTASSTVDFSAQTIGFKLAGSHARFSGCYADTCQTGFSLVTAFNHIDHALILWPSDLTATYAAVGVDSAPPAQACHLIGCEVNNGSSSITVTGIHEGASVWNLGIIGCRFIGSGFGTAPIISANATPDWYGIGNYWSAGTVGDRTKNKSATALLVDRGNANDVLLQWYGTNPGRLVALGSGSTGWVRFENTGGGGVQFGGVGNKLGFAGVTPVSPPSLTYSRATESAAATALRQALVALGLVVDNTTS